MVVVVIIDVTSKVIKILETVGYKNMYLSNASLFTIAIYNK